jgi:hypothetical protein
LLRVSSNNNNNNTHPLKNDLIMELSASIRNQRRLHDRVRRRCRRRHNGRRQRRHQGNSFARDKFDEATNNNNNNNNNNNDNNINNNNNNNKTPLGPYECAVIISVLIYWIFVSLIPVYNKFFFQPFLFPYPLATAGIQLGVVSFLLAFISVLQEVCYRQVDFSHQQQQQSEDDDHPIMSQSISTTISTTIITQRSWILGPHLFWKIKWCFPIGFLFGIKYGVTNLGLHLISAPTHLLLQSTDLVWTVLGAWLINGEVISGMELWCLMGCVCGSIVLGWQVSADKSVTDPLVAVLINLMSPMLLGLCISTLRLACVELMRPDNRVGGTVSSVELTSIKLMMSSLVALVLATLWEGGGPEDTPNWKNEPQAQSQQPTHQQQLVLPWWTAFAALPNSTKWGVLGGAGLIAVFQADCTFLTFLTNAVTVGLCGQVKIIPQWITATIFATKISNFTVKPTAILGAFLICGSAATFAYANWREWKEEEIAEGSSEEDGSTLVVSTETVLDDEELVPILPPSSSTTTTTSQSIMEKMNSCGAIRNTDGKHLHHHHLHHPPYLYADGDQWGDASIKLSFTETDVSHGRTTFPSPLLTTTTTAHPAISSKGNLTVGNPPITTTTPPLTTTTKNSTSPGHLARTNQ